MASIAIKINFQAVVVVLAMEISFWGELDFGAEEVELGSDGQILHTIRMKNFGSTGNWEGRWLFCEGDEETGYSGDHRCGHSGKDFERAYELRLDAVAAISAEDGRARPGAVVTESNMADVAPDIIGQISKGSDLQPVPGLIARSQRLPDRD